MRWWLCWMNWISKKRTLWPFRRADGFPGAGGSFAFADPAAEVGYAYAMNKVGGYMWDDPREKLLRDAFYGCLAKIE
jgi:CubicO group peptidase (beta-lactamase class C family)